MTILEVSGQSRHVTRNVSMLGSFVVLHFVDHVHKCQQGQVDTQIDVEPQQPQTLILFTSIDLNRALNEYISGRLLRMLRTIVLSDDKNRAVLSTQSVNMNSFDRSKSYTDLDLFVILDNSFIAIKQSLFGLLMGSFR